MIKSQLSKIMVISKVDLFQVCGSGDGKQGIARRNVGSGHMGI